MPQENDAIFQRLEYGDGGRRKRAQSCVSGRMLSAFCSRDADVGSEMAKNVVSKSVARERPQVLRGRPCKLSVISSGDTVAFILDAFAPLEDAHEPPLAAH